MVSVWCFPIPLWDNVHGFSLLACYVHHSLTAQPISHFIPPSLKNRGGNMDSAGYEAHDVQGPIQGEFNTRMSPSHQTHSVMCLSWFWISLCLSMKSCLSLLRPQYHLDCLGKFCSWRHTLQTPKLTFSAIVPVLWNALPSVIHGSANISKKETFSIPPCVHRFCSSAVRLLPKTMLSVLLSAVAKWHTLYKLCNRFCKLCY